MPIARVQMPDGRIARFEVAEGTAPAAIEAAASKLEGMGRDPNTGAYDEDLAGIDALMSGMAPGRPASEARAPVTLPFGLGEFSVGGGARDLVRATSNVNKSTSFPLVGATMASIAFPPAAAGIGLLSRFGAPVLASGIGGGMGGAAAESTDPNATPRSIARAGLRSGAEMAAAEAAGLGIGAVANRVIAPNIRVLDPLKPVRERVSAFARSLPEHTRGAVARFVEALPAGGVRNAADGVRAAATQVNDLFRTALVSTKAPKATASTRAVAERVAQTLNEKLGKHPMRLIDRVSRNGQMIETLRRRLTKSQFNEFLTVTLSRNLERATVTQNGRRVLDGDKFMELWRALPNETRQSFSGATRGAVESLAALGSTLRRAGQFAVSPVGREVVDMAVMPAVHASFGLSVGVPLMIARSLIAPGPVQKYLASSKLPSEFVRTLSRQAVTTPIRSGLLETDEEANERRRPTWTSPE